MDKISVIRAIRTRLSGNQRFRIIKECKRLYKANPHIAFYKMQVKLNIKAYFHIRPSYGCMHFKVTDSNIPSQLYHVTERSKLPSIKRDGLFNKKTMTVFLTSSDNYALYIIRRKKIKDPVLLRVNTEAMHKSGFLFFTDELNPFVWVVNLVPVHFIDFL